MRHVDTPLGTKLPLPQHSHGSSDPASRLEHCMCKKSATSATDKFYSWCVHFHGWSPGGSVYWPTAVDQELSKCQNDQNGGGRLSDDDACRCNHGGCIKHGTAFNFPSGRGFSMRCNSCALLVVRDRSFQETRAGNQQGAWTNEKLFS